MPKFVPAPGKVETLLKLGAQAPEKATMLMGKAAPALGNPATVFAMAGTMAAVLLIGYFLYEFATDPLSGQYRNSSEDYIDSRYVAFAGM